MENQGPKCVQCQGGKTGDGHLCAYCDGQGRVQSFEQWVAAGKPRTPKHRK